MRTECSVPDAGYSIMHYSRVAPSDWFVKKWILALLRQKSMCVLERLSEGMGALFVLMPYRENMTLVSTIPLVANSWATST